jgi:hypothetical protein
VIYRDRITVGLKVRTGTNPAGQPTYTTTTHQVFGHVSWIDSSPLTGAAGFTLQRRLRIILSPFDRTIPVDVGSNLTLTWGVFTNLTPDGAVEPHYLHGRLHHYEVVARVATA